MPLSAVKPENYQDQLDKKILTFRSLLPAFNTEALEVFPSPPLNFRMRAEFRIWHDEQGCHYAMFKKSDPKTPVYIEHFPIGSVTITELMPRLMVELHKDTILKDKLFQVEFLTSTTGEALISLIYHKPLRDDWLTAANKLAETLDSHIIGRSRKQRLVVGNDYIHDAFTIDDVCYSSMQIENSFTQPNAAINNKMLSWACQHSQTFSGDLLELYCGNGNFTLPLSKNFERVLATEISKTSVRAALHNLEKNKISNVEIVRLSAEEVTQALSAVREFRRLKTIDLDSYNFNTVFVDPPRAGLDDATLKLVSQFDNIIYISCNPRTLTENIIYLQQTHEVTNVAVFDQFPYTDHLESGVILKRR